MGKIAIIGGTGLTQMPELHIRNSESVATKYGSPSSPLYHGVLADTPHGHSTDKAAIDKPIMDKPVINKPSEIIFIARHGSDHSIPPHAVNYRANLAALHGAGVTSVIAVNAVGGIRADMGAGVLVVPDQIVDYTYGRDHTYCHGPDAPLQHVDFTCPYTESLRQHILAALASDEVEAIDGGVHAVTQGPRLESAAEINRLEKDGCDLVGMTGMPEAALARELGMNYACLALVVNPAAGRSSGQITMEDIKRVLDTRMPVIRTALVKACLQISELPAE